MGGTTAIERDIMQMANYWMIRKYRFLEAVADEFVRIVKPMAAYKTKVSKREIDMMNLAMTEWFLFERAFSDVGTPLEHFIAYPPNSTTHATLARLKQVAKTQFFSRFSILEKDAAAGVVVLQDTRDGAVYAVRDRHICAVDQWRRGVIALRIARVDGMWTTVGKMYLYDKAPFRGDVDEGPGALHPEDGHARLELEEAGFYLRLVRDVMGVEGRYARTLALRDLGRDEAVSITIEGDRSEAGDEEVRGAEEEPVAVGA